MTNEPNKPVEELTAKELAGIAGGAGAVGNREMLPVSDVFPEETGIMSRSEKELPLPIP